MDSQKIRKSHEWRESALISTLAKTSIGEESIYLAYASRSQHILDKLVQELK